MQGPITPSVTPGKVETFSACVGGWNARDPVAAMQPTDAVAMVNWFPRQADVITRLGYASACDLGTGAEVKSLFEYDFGQKQTLIAASAGGLYESGTDTPVTLATGYTDDHWSGDILSGHLFLANGVDTMQVYDGTTVANATFTGSGLDLTKLNFLKTFKSRVFAVEKNSQKMWYGGNTSITGTLTAFNFANVGGFRGNLMILAQISRDGNSGRAALFVAIFESGDCAVYDGSDPGDASNWGIVGRFKIGRPLSRFAVHETESEVYVLTDRGYEGISRSMPKGSEATRQDLRSAKISLAVSDAIRAVGRNDLWRCIVSPRDEMFIVNVPSAGASAAPEQHVQNVNTKAWTKFNQLDMQSFAMMGGKLHFGTSGGIVMVYGDVMTDNGNAIVCDLQTAWNGLRDAARKKLVTHICPYFYSLYVPEVSLAVGKNFTDPGVGLTSQYSAALPPEAIWDEAEWDAAVWGAEARAFQTWRKRTVNKALQVSTRITVSVNASRVQWQAISYLFQPGGIR